MKVNSNLLSIIIIILLVVLIGMGGVLIYNNKNNNNGNENNKFEENRDVNIYKDFVNKFKLNRGQNINRIDDVSINDELGIGSITINNNGDVELGLTDESLSTKYGRNYKLMSNVLTADVLECGNGGFRSIIFIKEDGTLAAIDAFTLINNKEIKLITDFGNAKNIIDVIQTSEFNAMTIKAIDIYGNVYDLTNYLI